MYRFFLSLSAAAAAAAACHTQIMQPTWELIYLNQIIIIMEAINVYSG